MFQKIMRTYARYRRNRSSTEGRRSGEIKCFECGGKGHYAQACPSRRRFFARKPVRCYNCRHIANVIKYRPEPPVGQTLNFKGPVGGAETRSQNFYIWLEIACVQMGNLWLYVNLRNRFKY